MSDMISRRAAIDALYHVDEYNGRSIEAIRQLPPAELSTNLADVGTDCISRQAAIEAIEFGITYVKVINTKTGEVTELFKKENEALEKAAERIKQLPSAQPEIIRCRECKFASGDSRICMKFGHSPIGELDFCAWAERRTDE